MGTSSAYRLGQFLFQFTFNDANKKAKEGVEKGGFQLGDVNSVVSVYALYVKSKYSDVWHSLNWFQVEVLCKLYLDKATHIQVDWDLVMEKKVPEVTDPPTNTGANSLNESQPRNNVYFSIELWC